MAIPIQNIYYLLCYAWNKLDEKERVRVDMDEHTTLQNLFAKILVNGTHLLLKRGVDKSYVETIEEYPGIKGKILMGESVKHNLLERQKSLCSFDEFSPDILINQILVGTIHKLLRTVGIEHELKQKLRTIRCMFPAIKRIQITSRTFGQVRLHRNNKFYEFLLSVCEIIHENLLPSEKDGEFHFRDFTRDERKMNQLFEAFVRNFYIKEQRDYPVVYKETIKWKLNPGDKASEKYKPSMHTDITLENEERKIIIDTKYYQETLSSFYDSEKIHSTNLYQLFSYLVNQEEGNEKSVKARGILLYPTVKAEYNLSYNYKHHPIEIRTVDLNADWMEISNRLLQIIKE